ncbi:MAG: hypothetical protein JXB06_05785, partial [Spirochaetales bacterium]|nr:hypothetical protein [Spirochaetales bacterium]
PVLGSRYTSFMHFPESDVANFYEGIHTIYGTGGKFEFAPLEKNWLLDVYIYQDSAPGVFTSGTAPNVTLDFGHASVDVRTAFNFEKVRLEAFLGATFPTSDSSIGYYRGGLFLHAGTEKVEFMAGLGLPLWKPLDDVLLVDRFYILVEQRVHLGPMSIVPTVFYRPKYYLQAPTGEEALDINLDIQFHGREESLISGGIEGNFVYQTDPPPSQMIGKAIPYIQLSTPGVVYKAQVNAKVWPFDMSNMARMFEAFLSIEAAF